MVAASMAKHIINNHTVVQLLEDPAHTEVAKVQIWAGQPKKVLSGG